MRCAAASVAETAARAGPTRRAGAALEHDRPGHARKSEASTAFAPHTAPHVREQAKFARELAHEIEQATLAGRVPGLVVLASLPFLGELRAQLGAAARRCLKTAVAVDLTSYRDAELEHRVSRALQEQGGAAPGAG